uniref:CSN8_PSD8_EIF3K domain-containing protein n=1 Tax=Syphacia muris TaxID=451379 RepID=A0A0N5AY85_9BILA
LNLNFNDDLITALQLFTYFKAIPIRVKILLHKVLSDLDASTVKEVITNAGWTPEDFERGFIEKVRICVDSTANALMLYETSVSILF